MWFWMRGAMVSRTLGLTVRAPWQCHVLAIPTSLATLSQVTPERKCIPSFVVGYRHRPVCQVTGLFPTPVPKSRSLGHLLTQRPFQARSIARGSSPRVAWGLSVVRYHTDEDRFRDNQL